MYLSLVVAMARNSVIGLDGKIPWHLSEDLKYFKKITLGKPIIMGRKTCNSIGRPLPDRRNIVVSSNLKFCSNGFDVFNSIDAALNDCQEQAEVMIIGGATLYKALLPKADRLYITYIHKKFKGDTFFPNFNLKQWQEIYRQDVSGDTQEKLKYSFVVLKTRK